MGINDIYHRHYLARVGHRPLAHKDQTMPEFHETRRGATFYDVHVPHIAEALRTIGVALTEAVKADALDAALREFYEAQCAFDAEDEDSDAAGWRTAADRLTAAHAVVERLVEAR